MLSCNAWNDPSLSIQTHFHPFFYNLVLINFLFLSLLFSQKLLKLLFFHLVGSHLLVILLVIYLSSTCHLLVIPLFKKGSRNSVSNYRPISLTSSCCKVMESIIHDSLSHYLLSNNLLSDHQHGFIKSRSTLTLGRPGGGGWIPPLLAFSPVTFLMIPIAKIASAYLLLGMGDTFWHMWHHLDAVTWHMSWCHMYMTVVKIHCFYHCLLIEISFDVDVIKQ